MNASIDALEKQLKHVDASIRRRALAELAALIRQGALSLPPVREVANMHCHTFFSFNAYGHSPSSLAWLAKKEGYKLIGIVDFDTLAGVDEFLQACDLLGVRGSAGMETRVYIPEFATREINSPGEPGIFYYMGIGFAASAVPPTAAHILDRLRRRADQRNRGLIERINAFLQPVAVEYERDVLPLAPGNVTERHIVAAYLQAVARTLPDPTPFWAAKLGLETAETRALMDDLPHFKKQVRARLMKRGSVGYVPPDSGSFPTVDQVNELIDACGALPCATWLDGLSQGEQDIEELLELLIGKGVVALNIIPDRNWNIADPELRRVKVRNLYTVVDLARELDLPLNVGTEMNSFGQKRIDDFTTPALAPVRQAFLDGAYFIYGHTAAQRALGIGYRSAWAAENLPGRKDKNAFYTTLGRRLPPGSEGQAKLTQAGAGTPNQILGALS